MDAEILVFLWKDESVFVLLNLAENGKNSHLKNGNLQLTARTTTWYPLWNK
jgi:hypothetical protein